MCYLFFSHKCSRIEVMPYDQLNLQLLFIHMKKWYLRIEILFTSLDLYVTSISRFNTKNECKKLEIKKYKCKNINTLFGFEV